jgi:ABC-2 type transport system permease protein
VVVVALFAGDTVASEASWSSLRYLLAAPVPRSHLLRRKLTVALLYAAFAIVLLPSVAYLAGGLFFGWAPLRSPLGASLDPGTAVARIAIFVAYVARSLLVRRRARVPARGVDRSRRWAPSAAPVMLVIVSNILDAVTALATGAACMPTHYSYAWDRHPDRR